MTIVVVVVVTFLVILMGMVTLVDMVIGSVINVAAPSILSLIIE